MKKTAVVIAVLFVGVLAFRSYSAITPADKFVEMQDIILNLSNGKVRLEYTVYVLDGDVKLQRHKRIEYDSIHFDAMKAEAIAKMNTAEGK